MTSCVVSGSFDPFTSGHLFLVNEGLALFDHVHVILAGNPSKPGGLLTHQQRHAVLAELFAGNPRVSVEQLAPGRLLVLRAQELGATAILRGLRNTTDFEYEHSLDLVQGKISTVRTVYLITPREYTEVSSSMIRALYGLESWETIIGDYVPEVVMRLLKNLKA